MDDLISRLSELRCQYNCFDENERDAYHALSEAIKALSDVPDTNIGDTINRQAAIDALIDALAWTWSGTWSEKTAIDAIKNLPSVDAVEVKHGRWEKTEESPMRPYMCSQCGSLFDLDTLLGIPTWRWCPKCGAKMEVDDETD